MSTETEFFIFLLENYASYKNTTADVILKQWDDLGIIEYIQDMYELYHVERIENAYDDIDKIVEEARKK
ncbi:MAG: DUF3791 domain-containing protein [Erysipelotrichaceae bacterium]|nr:DUF3791 domain-containing protein [Erysipelotrichaceae bacterium]